MSYPSAAELLGLASAEQSSVWLVGQTGPGASVPQVVSSLGHSRARQVVLLRQVKQLGQSWAGGVRRPRTCAGSGQEYLAPRTVTARTGIQCSSLWCM